MSESLFSALIRSLDIVEPGDLVIYHGSIPARHGFHIATPCVCPHCLLAGEYGSEDLRYHLIDPWDETARPLRCVRPESITLCASACD
ncbi:hypothetical protein [Streptomyces mobaraensis]|uniref:Uncharacterized protein n=1 Tax=Streptomyces mobaraensis TaxID=35621 RepID=A0A5N5WEF6_STRMB|nr:hypothetical protein [Streptomyces mobaraensis]KAB7850159.1 hypothetical protein FRZ00_06055 [Streptomyces mobaraensis]